MMVVNQDKGFGEEDLVFFLSIFENLFPERRNEFSNDGIIFNDEFIEKLFYKEKNMNNVIDLDDVLLSRDVFSAWNEFAQRIAMQLQSLSITDPSQIPDEQGRINTDGSLTIFVTLPNGEVSMIVPKGHWTYQSKH